ncbi:helix-turn-helix domain-containing protein [Pseudomonas mosselii]|uniref:hypothetical protein n=1 Tax=Pseudomonas mosselii TaxID=78327 RepID=UPI0021D9117F|nr:hypothetical protein [Pseudomonas mosselii]MCU9527569.1 hypothetical protein [Pseudomonas mosselii]MCU9534882.1 hypothetical protein [Pseudomonas mosselii]MCU9542385.1 hypothetical protein [Pseudomonas mosselii]MCU9546722.1 hypothetical protein [Pseudomonas mosselii]
MRLVRNSWLAGLSSDQFLNLDPWAFVIHGESQQQWVAEIRLKLSVRLSDEELLQIVYPGLCDATKNAIKNYADGAPEGRGRCLIGYALSFIRKYGCALVIDEVPGAGAYQLGDLDALDYAPRAHGLEPDYLNAASSYTDSLSVLPQFLSDGIVLSDEGLQKRHIHVETLRRFLTHREHQILRLAVLEQHCSVDMCSMLGLGEKQVWKVRRQLNRKLSEIAIDQGISPEIVAALSGKEMAVAGE